MPETVGGERIWPPSGLRPVGPGRRLAGERDSTAYNGDPNQLPGGAGLELFTDLAIVGDYVYTAFNSGLQVWDVSGSFAAAPRLVSARNGWSGHFLKFEERHKTENIFPVVGIDAIDPPTPGEDVMIALAGHKNVGLTIWDAADKQALKLLYQDWDRRGEDVATVNVKGRTYALFAVTDSNPGLQVYDMTAARSLAKPCLEDAADAILCPGVYKGKLGDWSSVLYVSHLERNNRHFVAVSDGSSPTFGVSIHEVKDFSAVRSDQVFSGLERSSEGVGLFQHGGRAYLALKGFTDLRIFDVTACLDSGNCSALTRSPAWSTTVGDAGGLVSVSSAGAPYVYFGSGSPCLKGTKKEFLYNLGELGSANPAFVEATAFPPGAPPERDGKFPDAQTGHDVDYWGYYLDKNTSGFSYVIPRAAKVRRAKNGTVYLYRTASTLFDVHEFSIVDPKPVIPGIEIVPGGGSYPQGQQLTFRSSGTVLGQEPLVYRWTVRDERKAAVPMPDSTAAEFRLNTCGLSLDGTAVFADGFESGNTSHWSRTTPRIAGIASVELKAAAGGVPFTVELRVTATVKGETFTDQKLAPFEIFPPGDPAFTSPPLTASSLGGGRYALAAHTNGFETEVRWLVQDDNGTATCNFGGGSVRCMVFDWGREGTRLTYPWAEPNSGPRKVRAVIRRLLCDGRHQTSAPAEINVHVVVTPPARPEVTRFNVLEGGFASCVCPGFGLPCTCVSGKAVSFEVTTDDQATALEFTWGDGQVQTLSPSAINRYSHTYASGSYSPTVKAIAGGHVSQTGRLPEGLVEIQ